MSCSIKRPFKQTQNQSYNHIFLFKKKLECEDNRFNYREQEEWKDNEEEEKMTWIGNFKEFIRGVLNFTD